MTHTSSNDIVPIVKWPKLFGLECLCEMEANSFVVPKFTSFEVSKWTSDSGSIIDMLQSDLNCELVVVRSCAAMEDEISTEPPGFFESVLDVKLSNIDDLRKAIDVVCNSYARRGTDEDTHKVIVQEQLLNPAQSGVCRVGKLKDDYVEIDYDSSLFRTDAVTSGLKSQRILLSNCIDQLPEPWSRLRKAVEEIRCCLQPPFFLEFAIDKFGSTVIFQIRSDRRPMQSSCAPPPNRKEFLEAGKDIKTYGPLSVMADWNPAEMLGLEPKALDISLYDNLLMSGAWVDGRVSLGWRVPAEKQLMVTVGNRPYIKLQSSLESLLPQDIPQDLAAKIVSNRLALLERSPQHHDKIEFKIMWSAFAFDQDKLNNELRSEGLNDKEVETLFKSLRQITEKTLSKAPLVLLQDQEGIEMLHEFRNSLAGISLDFMPKRVGNLLEKSLDACRTFGTIPFARQARAAFTFRFIINHLIENDEVLAGQVSNWETGLNTVTRKMTTDLRKLDSGELSKQEFDKVYGHLRPSTYDLESQRYDERLIPVNAVESKSYKGANMPAKSARLREILNSVDSKISESKFWESAANAFRAREDLKFEFSALLSDILLILGRLADWAEVKRSDLRNLKIIEIIDLVNTSGSWLEFKRRVSPALEQLGVETTWRLPDVIFCSEDIHIVKELDVKPTFIGAMSKTGRLQLINGDVPLNSNLADSVVAIEAPNPGFDWIFSQDIGAFVSAYGGEFSHMGIRCAEFKIPAALGCGRKLFASLVSSTSVTIVPKHQELWGNERKLYPS